MEFPSFEKSVFFFKSMLLSEANGSAATAGRFLWWPEKQINATHCPVLFWAHSLPGIIGKQRRENDPLKFKLGI